MIYVLAIYFLFIILYVGYSAAGIYHLIRFGYVGDLTRPILWLYITVSIAVILISFLLIVLRDWTPQISAPI